MNRRDFLFTALGAGIATVAAPAWTRADPAASLGFHLTDVTNAAGIQFRHNSGAYGGKLLPETLGSGCSFLDYDRDGWQDVLLVNEKRSEERRVGKECRALCRSRWSPYH